jgi:hypothetical protein
MAFQATELHEGTPLAEVNLKVLSDNPSPPTRSTGFFTGVGQIRDRHKLYYTPY